MFSKISLSRMFSVLLVVIFMLAQATPALAVAQAAPASVTGALFTSCAAVTEIPQAECNALLALYNSTNGAGWTYKTGWLQTETPCSWYGVYCSSGTNVTELYLDSNQLSGSIPTELGNLTQLHGLVLDNNQLSGSIPTQLGNLTQLQQLFLSINHSPYAAKQTGLNSRSLA